MANTTQNRAMVLASALRLAVKKLATIRPERFETTLRPTHDEVVADIESVAEELEKVAQGNQ